MISVGNTTNSYKNNASDIYFGANPIPYAVSKTLKKSLFNVKSADIFVHVSPDTDSDAATTASMLASKLKEKGVDVQIKADTKKINDLIFNPGYKESKPSSRVADVSILVDVNEIKRTGDETSGKVFVFDHHLDTGSLKNAYKYIDETARSCSGMMFLLFKSWHEKISKPQAQNFLYGVYDDFIKSKYIKIVDSKVEELPAFKKDKNSQKVVKGIRKYLSKDEIAAVVKRLDVMSNLTDTEKALQKKLFSDIKITPNGKLAYVIIDSNDKQWLSLGMDNTRNSTILRDFRMRLINGIYKDEALSSEQRENLKNIQGAAVFYRAGDDYQMSIHTKNDYAKKLIEKINEQIINQNLEEVGGHPNRSGGRVHSLEPEDIENFMKKFWIANEEVGKEFEPLVSLNKVA